MKALTAKRVACDRCRDQKLRCPQAADGSGTCERCNRVGAVCVTSSARPPGRPPISKMPGRRSTASLNETVKPRVTTLDQFDAHNSNDVSTTTLPSPGARTTRSSSRHENQYSSNFMQNGNAMFTSDGSVCMPSSVSPHHDPLTYTLDTPSPIYGIPLNIDLWASVEEGGIDMSAWLDKQQKIGNLQEQTATNSAAAPGSDNPSRSHSMPNHEPMPWLVGILGNILQQVTELSSSHWDLEMMHMSWFDGCDPISTSALEPLSPLEHSVSLMVKFVLTLQVILPRDSSLNSPTLNLSTALMILSAYLKFIHLLDAMLSQVSRCIQEQQNQQRAADSGGGMPREDTSFLWEPTVVWQPVLESGKGFHIKIIIRIFEQQLQSIEMLMGLPAEYRRWSHVSPDTDTPGIFSHHSASLLEAIIGHNQTPEGEQGSNQFSSVQKAMESLKSEISSF